MPPLSLDSPSQCWCGLKGGGAGGGRGWRGEGVPSALTGPRRGGGVPSYLPPTDTSAVTISPTPPPGSTGQPPKQRSLSGRSEEPKSHLQSLEQITYADFFLYN